MLCRSDKAFTVSRDKQVNYSRFKLESDQLVFDFYILKELEL